MIFRSILSFVLSYCLAMYPVNAKTVAQQEALRNFIKDSGMGQSNMTIAEWIKKNRAYYHPKVAELAAQWAAKNPNMKMPQLKMTSFDGSNGQETTRLVFQEKGETTTVDIVTQGDKMTVNYDGKKYSYDDIYYDGQIEKAADSSQITWNELSRVHKLNKKKAAIYQGNLRALVNSLTAFQQINNESPRKTSFIDMLLEQAYAVADGSRCIMGGYSTEQKSGSCGGADAKLKEGCIAGNVRCNPVVYGYSDGKAYCVPKKPATDVSVTCDKLYPIPGKEQQLVDSVIKNINAKQPQERDQAWNDFFKNLETDIRSAGEVCMGPTFNFDRLKETVKQEGQTKHFKAEQFTGNFPVKMAGGKDVNLHHRIACETVMNRLFYMDQAKDCVRGSLAEQDAGVPQSKTDSKECKYAGVVIGKVTDNAPTIVEPLPEDKATTLPPVVVKAEKEKKDKKWLWILLAGLGAACLFIFCKKGDKKKPPQVTPPTLPPVLPPMPVGKPGEPTNPRSGSGGVTGGTTGGTPITLPAAPATTGGVLPRGGVN